ncbi:MAG: hypothetical protein ABL904_17470, partial [Hyphomicrobiaceae bacterium]
RSDAPSAFAVSLVIKLLDPVRASVPAEIIQSSTLNNSIIAHKQCNVTFYSTSQSKEIEYEFDQGPNNLRGSVLP